MRKNEYEEQLFNNEEEKYEFDSNIQCMKAVIRQVERRQNLHGPLMQKMLANLYPNENIHKIVASNTEIAEQVILPRLKQKLNELIKCRKKF